MTHRQRPCSNSKTKHGKAVDRVRVTSRILRDTLRSRFISARAEFQKGVKYRDGYDTSGHFLARGKLIPRNPPFLPEFSPKENLISPSPFAFLLLRKMYSLHNKKNLPFPNAINIIIIIIIIKRAEQTRMKKKKCLHTLFLFQIKCQDQEIQNGVKKK